MNIKKGTRVRLISNKEFDNAVNAKFQRYPKVEIGECGIVVSSSIEGLFEVQFERERVICNEAMVEIFLTGMRKKPLGYDPHSFG